MGYVNQNGEDVFEETLRFWSDCEILELQACLFLLADHLGVSFVRTNAITHGDTQIILVKHAMEG